MAEDQWADRDYVLEAVRRGAIGKRTGPRSSPECRTAAAADTIMI